MRGLLALLAAAASLAAGAALAADFRLVTLTDTLATIVDAEAIEVSGDVRVASFYTATTEANIFGRTRLQFDCAQRRMRPESMLGIDPVTGKTGREKILTDGWTPSDRTVSDSRTTKLVCGPPETRDTYARHLPQDDWRSALLAAFEPLRGAFALAFDLPVGGKELLCSGGAVVRPETGPPVSTNGGFRVEVDTEHKTLLFRDPLGPGVASDYAIARPSGGTMIIAARPGTSDAAGGRLDLGARSLRIEGTRASGGGYVADLHCAASRPLPRSP